MFHRLWKPWFVYRPTRLLHRAAAALRPPPRGYTPLRTSWGVPIIADPSRAIGWSILTTGIYDLAVSEVLARLVSSGDTVVDAGVNVGYMTVLACVVAGPQGRVISFEPVPELFAVAEQNAVAVGKQLPAARAELHQSALGERPGNAQLRLPANFDSNDGIARIDPTATAGGRVVTVAVETLDDVLGTGPVAVLKLDVEGYEAQVLRGSSRVLAGHQVRHILFEDHAIDTSEAVPILRAAGYHLFSLGWSMRGLLVRPVEAGSLATEYEAPNYVATLEPAEVLARCRPKGWLVLGSSLTRRHH